MASTYTKFDEVAAGVLRRARTSTGMRAVELAELCKDSGVPMSQTIISSLETGRKRFQVAQVAVLAEALGLSPAAFFGADSRACSSNHSVTADFALKSAIRQLEQVRASLATPEQEGEK